MNVADLVRADGETWRDYAMLYLEISITKISLELSIFVNHPTAEGSFSFTSQSRCSSSRHENQSRRYSSALTIARDVSDSPRCVLPQILLYHVRFQIRNEFAKIYSPLNYYAFFTHNSFGLLTAWLMMLEIDCSSKVSRFISGPLYMCVFWHLEKINDIYLFVHYIFENMLNKQHNIFLSLKVIPKIQK